MHFCAFCANFFSDQPEIVASLSLYISNPQTLIRSPGRTEAPQHSRRSATESHRRSRNSDQGRNRKRKQEEQTEARADHTEQQTATGAGAGAQPEANGRNTKQSIRNRMMTAEAGTERTESEIRAGRAHKLGGFACGGCLERSSRG